jgi:hypothetical protein
MTLDLPNGLICIIFELESKKEIHSSPKLRPCDQTENLTQRPQKYCILNDEASTENLAG